MWPFFHSHSVHPTHSLIGLPRIPVTDPAVSTHSSSIFLSAYSSPIIFWYKYWSRSLLPPASSLISSPWPLKISATPPLHPVPKLTHCCSSVHPGSPSSLFRVIFLLLHRTSLLSSSLCPRIWADFFAISFFPFFFFSCCSACVPLIF